MRHRPVAAAVVGAVLVLSGCAAADEPAGPDPTGEVTRYPGAIAEVVRTASCQCCGEHVDYLVDAGFDVRDTVVAGAELQALRADLAIPVEMRSCHTTLVERPESRDDGPAELRDRAAVEGHVPVDDIDAALDAGVDGVALPGMPPGAPGMPGEATGPLPLHHLEQGRGEPVTPVGR